MLGVNWRDFATGTPTRAVSAATSAALVCACTTVRPCRRATAVRPVSGNARNATMKRCACGPMLTGGRRTGLYSSSANAGLPVRMRAHARAAHAKLAHARAAVEPSFARQFMLERSAGAARPKSTVRLIRYRERGLLD